MLRLLANTTDLTKLGTTTLTVFPKLLKLSVFEQCRPLSMLRKVAVTSMLKINSHQYSFNVTHMRSSAGVPTMLRGVENDKNRVMTPFQTRASSSTSSHVALWSAEKAFSAALLPIIPMAFICPSPIMDYLLAFTITLHSHWGIEAIVVDYVRPSVFGPVIPKIAVALVFALSALTLGGLAYFTYTDVGLVQAIKMLWKL